MDRQTYKCPCGFTTHSPIATWAHAFFEKHARDPEAEDPARVLWMWFECDQRDAAGEPYEIR